MIHLLGVSGSLREQSSGLRALNILLEFAREFGAEMRLLDLRKADLPMYNPDAAPCERAKLVVADVTWANAFVLASPDYHGTMSGAMKNFLDYHWSEFTGKLFGYLCTSHEKGITVMEGMRLTVRQCYGWSLPYGLSIHTPSDFDESGQIKSAKLHSRLRMTARDLVTYGGLLYEQFQKDVTTKDPDSFAARYT